MAASFLKGSTLPLPAVSNMKAEQVIRSPTPTPFLPHKIEEQDEEGDNPVTYRGRIGQRALPLAQPRPSKCNNLLHNHAATKITALKDIPGYGSGATATATTMVTLER